ncbi:MAG: hypothetical protein LV481_14565 [Methylacidiphilales bacterium]|nr:hypothetical protein [Candidatus Methylacidiphilales bacterium]
MSDLKKINHRFVTCFQSSGRIGKSTAFQGILTWARFAGISVAAVDCDAEHRTLSKLFPEAAFVDATRSNDEFLQLIMDLPDAPLAVADFPAQATDFLLGAMESLRVLDALDARETRMTILMFAADDPTATASMAKTYRALGDRADYLLVKNPARFRSQAFDESALAELFRKNKVPVLELPAVTTTTLQKIAAASAEKKKHLTFSDAVKVPSIHQMCRFEIEHFLNRVFVQCEDAERILIPDSTTLENKVFRPADRLARPVIDEFNPLDIHE